MDLDDVRFRLFLHTGQYMASCKYVAGSCKVPVELESLRELGIDKAVKDVDRAKFIIETIASAHIDESPTFPIVFALTATVAHIPKTDKFSIALKDLYTLIPIVLHNSERLMLFNKIGSHFKLTKGTVWQRCMRAWYADCNYRVLIDNLITNKSHYGWTHKHIHNLLHSPGLNDVHKLFCKYLYEGLDSALKLDNIPIDISNQLRVVDKLKRTKDSQEVVDIIGCNEFIRYQHVPIFWFNLKNKPYKIWKAIIRRMNLNDLLSNIIEIYKLKTFDESGNDFPEILSEINKVVLNSVACPIMAFLVYGEFKSAVRLFKHKKHTKKTIKTKNTPDIKETNLDNVQDGSQNKLIKSNTTSLSETNLTIGLLSLVNRSLLTTPQDCNINCLITLDLREHMFTRSKPLKNKELTPLEANLEGLEVHPTVEKPKTRAAKCFYSKSTTPGDAAVFLALYLSKCIKNTVLSVYSNPNIHVIFDFKISKGELTTFEDIKETLKNSKCEQVSFNKPFEWAILNKQNVDFFVNVVDSYSRNKECLRKKKKSTKNLNIHEGLKSYQNAMNKPNARAVIVSLCCRDVPSMDGFNDNILHIAGFDENIPKIIKNYALRII